MKPIGEAHVEVPFVGQVTGWYCWLATDALESIGICTCKSSLHAIEMQGIYQFQKAGEK